MPLNDRAMIWTCSVPRCGSSRWGCSWYLSIITERIRKNCKLSRITSTLKPQIQYEFKMFEFKCKTWESLNGDLSGPLLVLTDQFWQAGDEGSDLAALAEVTQNASFHNDVWLSLFFFSIRPTTVCLRHGHSDYFFVANAKPKVYFNAN